MTLEGIALKLASIFIGVGMEKAGNWIQKKVSARKTISVDELKKSIQVLFVDDEDVSSTLETIRNAGWNVRQVTDVTNFDSAAIKNADIIFMDFTGVGKVLTPKEEGIGLIKSIKKRHPEKFLVFYSGYAGFIPGHEVHSYADAWMDKHADPFLYIDQIEAASTQIYESK